MVAKIVGYKVISKDDKMLCLISFLRESLKDRGEVGLISDTQFIPPYCIDKVDSYVGKICNITYHKYRDKYTISNIDVLDSEALNI